MGSQSGVMNQRNLQFLMLKLQFVKVNTELNQKVVDLIDQGDSWLVKLKQMNLKQNMLSMQRGSLR